MKNVTKYKQNQSPSAEFSVENLIEELTIKNRVIEQNSKLIDELKKRIGQLEAYLRLEKNRHYGFSSEAHPEQGELFNEAEQVVAEDEAQKTEKKPTKKSKAGRKGLSDKLPREQVYLNLTEEEKQGAINTFLQQNKRRAGYHSGQGTVRVLEYLQEKAVFVEEGKQTLIAAKQPAHPLGKSIASTSLLAYIIIVKYCDALPLYRLEKILQRYGGRITRTSMANWIIRLSEVYISLINLMKAHQLKSDYLQADETSNTPTSSQLYL